MTQTTRKQQLKQEYVPTPEPAPAGGNCRESLTFVYCFRTRTGWGRKSGYDKYSSLHYSPLLSKLVKLIYYNNSLN